MTARLDAALQHILVYMNMSTFEALPQHGGSVRNALIRIPPRFFDGAEPIAFSEDFEQLGGYPDEEYIFADARLRDLGAPLDVALVGVENDERRGGAYPTSERFTLQRYRAVDASQVRGKVRHIAPWMVECSIAFVETATGKASTARTYLAELGANRWENITAGTRGGLVLTASPTVSIGMQFARRYQWRVYLAFEGLPGITVPTDPSGAQAAFRLRDLPEGRSRRDSLRHFVSEHYRKKPRDNDEALVFVKRHLRGVTEFRWNGLNVRITPPAFDIEQLTKDELR